MTHHLLEALISQPCFFLLARVIAKQGRRKQGAGGWLLPPRPPLILVDHLSLSQWGWGGRLHIVHNHNIKTTLPPRMFRPTYGRSLQKVYLLRIAIACQSRWRNINEMSLFKLFNRCVHFNSWDEKWIHQQSTHIMKSMESVWVTLAFCTFAAYSTK